VFISFLGFQVAKKYKEVIKVRFKIKKRRRKDSAIFSNYSCKQMNFDQYLSFAFFKTSLKCHNTSTLKQSGHEPEHGKLFNDIYKTINNEYVMIKQAIMSKHPGLDHHFPKFVYSLSVGSFLKHV
jgi:hypothetical protein